jgi:anti-anti-sigma factor
MQKGADDGGFPVIDLSRVSLEGECDFVRREEIAGIFDSLDVGRQVLIDLEKVTYIDSSVLSELSRLRRRSKGQTITLTGASPNVRRIFDVVGFGELFEIS